MSFVRANPKAVIVAMFIAAFSSYFIIPYYVIYLHQKIGLPIITISMLVMITAILERGVTLPAGFMADKTGAKKIAIIGVLLRCASLLTLSMSTEFIHFLLVAILSGIGSAFFSVGGKKAMLDMTGNDIKIFALRSLAINAGISTGPVLGYFMIGYDFRTLCFYNAMAYVFVAAIYFLCISSENKKSIGDSRKRKQIFSDMLQNPSLLSLTITQVFFFFLYTFLDLIFPLYASQHISILAVGLTFSLNSVVVITVNYLMAKHLEKITFPLAYGFIFFTFSFLTIYFSSIVSGQMSLLFYLLGIVLFSFAEIFFMLMIDIRAIKSVHKLQYGTVMGVMGFVAMIGVGLGNIINGSLYEFFSDRNLFQYFWLSVTVLSFTFIVISLIISRREKI